MASLKMSFYELSRHQRTLTFFIFNWSHRILWRNYSCRWCKWTMSKIFETNHWVSSIYQPPGECAWYSHIRCSPRAKNSLLTVHESYSFFLLLTRQSTDKCFQVTVRYLHHKQSTILVNFVSVYTCLVFKNLITERISHSDGTVSVDDIF